MLHKLRRRAQDEQGFTLIELLVVILIIGILAAVAIPTFLNQRGKGYDANAQSVVKNMQLAAETYATGDNGTYPSTLSELQGIDPSIQVGAGKSVSAASITGGGTTADTYTVSTTAQSTGDVFNIVETNGQASDTCTSTTSGGGPGGCPSGSTW